MAATTNDRQQTLLCSLSASTDILFFDIFGLQGRHLYMLSQSPAGGFHCESLMVTDKGDSVVTQKLTLSSEKQNGAAENEFNT